MKLTNISGTNIKGRSFNHPIGPITIITGDNGKGKSAITDAVRLALLGYHPALGKTASAAFGLSDGGDMRVRADFATAQSITRTWTRIGKTIKNESDIAGFGHGGEFPEVLFAARSFLDQTAKARTAALFEQVSQGFAFDACMITGNVKAIQLDGPDPEVEKLLIEYIETIESLDQEREEIGQPLHTWLEKVVAHFKEIESTAASVVKQMKASQQAQAQLQAASGLVPVRQGVDAELTAQRAKLEAAVTEQNAASAKLQQANDWASRLNQAHARRCQNPDCSERLSVVTDEYDAIQKKIEGRKLEAGGYQSKLGAAQSAAATAAAMVNAAREKLCGLEMKLNELTAQDCCPSCASKSKGWKQRCIDKAQPDIANAKEALEKLNAAKALSDEKLLEAKKVMAGLIDQDRQLIDDGEIRNKLANELHKLQSQQDMFMNATDFIATAPAQQSTDVLQADLTSCQIAVNGLRNEVAGLQAAQRLAVAAKADEARREEAKAALACNVRIQAVAKAVNKIIIETQETIIKETVGAFMADAGALLTRVMWKKLELKDGEIGYYADTGKFVGCETFSGAEEYTAFAGLALALASKSPCKLVIMDELGRLKGQRKYDLLAVVQELVAAGKIDNFIGIDPEDMAWAGQPVHLISL